jgi:hypothetical protein
LECVNWLCCAPRSLLWRPSLQETSC